MLVGLSADREYHIRVSARNKEGYGNGIFVSDTPSEAAAAPVVVPGAAPIVKTNGAPLELEATSDASGDVQITWKPPSKLDTVSAPSKYALDMAFDREFKQGLTRLSESDILSFRASALHPDTLYWFRVTAHNGAGDGEPAIASARTAPKKVTAVVNGNPAHKCPNDCSGNGVCLPATGTCTCLSRFEGPACNMIRTEPPQQQQQQAGAPAAAAAAAKDEDPVYCKAMCAGACGSLCRRFCPSDCPKLNQAPRLICTNKCGGACSVACTRLCPEQCPTLTSATDVPTVDIKRGTAAKHASSSAATAAAKIAADGAQAAALAVDSSVDSDAAAAGPVLECAERSATGTCLRFHWNVPGASGERVADEWDLDSDEMQIKRK
jgi:hypothetical protein